ncbi:MAG: hypothetical protein Q9159_006119 [Coniocarpon cinnabarinum]
MSTAISIPDLSDGYLPLAVLVTAAASFFNTAQCFLTTKLAKRIYNTADMKPPDSTKGHPAQTQSQVTPLSCRSLGIWTLLSGIVRLYSTYHLGDVHCYRLCFATYICAFVHFALEVAVFGTANLSGVAREPLITSSAMTGWMWYCWGHYVG